MDEVFRLHGEFVRRLSHAGVRGVPELVELYERVRRAADAISIEEIDAMLIRIGSLRDRLHLISSRLDEIERIRQALVAGPDTAKFDSELADEYVRKHARSS